MSFNQYFRKKEKTNYLKTTTVFKNIAYFSKNGTKNDYFMLKQMKNVLWVTLRHKKYHSKA